MFELFNFEQVFLQGGVSCRRDSVNSYTVLLLPSIIRNMTWGSGSVESKLNSPKTYLPATQNNCASQSRMTAGGQSPRSVRCDTAVSLKPAQLSRAERLVAAASR